MSNPISSVLPETVDTLLQDLAQMTGMISYTQIMTAHTRLAKEEILLLEGIAIKHYNGDSLVLSEDYAVIDPTLLQLLRKVKE